jgi:hypothetical protein
MSTPVKRAGEAKMSTRWSISSSASGGTFARFTAASTPARTSASISPGVRCTIEPSPMRV